MKFILLCVGRISIH